jgi:hypothetical protein
MSALRWLFSNWKDVVIGAVVLVLIWAFTPSCATRAGARAEAAAQQAIEDSKIHEEMADVAEKAAEKEAEARKPIEAERERLAKDKADLTAQVARLRAGLPPRPVVVQGNGVPGAPVDPAGVETPGYDFPLVQKLYDVIDAQAALILKHEEDDAKSESLIASLRRSEASWKTSSEEQQARGDDLRTALRQKELQITAMKSAQLGMKIRYFTYGAIAGGGTTLLLRR